MKKYAAIDSSTAWRPTAMPAVMNPANVASELNWLTNPKVRTAHTRNPIMTRRSTRNCPPPWIADVSERDPAPHFRKDQHCSQCQQDPQDSQHDGSEDVFRLAGNRVAPLLQIRLRIVQYDDFLAQGQNRIRQLFKSA